MEIIYFVLVWVVLILFAVLVFAIYVGLFCEDIEQKHKEASAKEFNEEWGDE